MDDSYPYWLYVQPRLKIAAILAADILERLQRDPNAAYTLDWRT